MDSNKHGSRKYKKLEYFTSHAQDRYSHSGMFGRMFPDRIPAQHDPETLRNLGALHGPMDLKGQSSGSSDVAVGQVFFGQFIDHDITLDVTSSLDAISDVSSISNERTPQLDLDCIYGRGPEASPFLYAQEGRFKGVKLLTGADGSAIEQAEELKLHDLVRSPHGTAVIGDPRNDENRVVSQIQLAFLRLHNSVAEWLKHRKPHASNEALYNETRSLVLRHYHWVVIHDFLTEICGEHTVQDILNNGRQFYRPNSKPFIPVEFSVAAYRFGHSMVPAKIRVQAGQEELALFGSELGKGFTPLNSPAAIVDLHSIFKTAATQDVQNADALDSKLSSALLNLPFISEGEKSLASRNLLRGRSFQLPSGEEVAASTGSSKSQIRQVSKEASSQSGGLFDSETPLWYYLLVEAQLVGKQLSVSEYSPGDGLGPTGARIVAEVIIGLIELDSSSYLSSQPYWEPIDGLGQHMGTVGDLLTFEATGI